MERPIIQSTIVPKLVRRIASSISESLTNLNSEIAKEIATQKENEDKRIVAHTFRSTDIEIFPSLQLCLLPDVKGRHREEFRAQVEKQAIDPLSELLSFAEKPKKKKCILFQGKASGSYLRRLQKEFDAHVVVVEQTTENIANHITQCGFRDGTSDVQNFTFIRGSLLHILHKLTRPSSIDSVVLSSPAPYRPERSSHSRVINRDFFLIAHRSLKERRDESDDRGILMWTDCKPYWAFAQEQMDEAKLLVPFAKKKPSVMKSYFPTQQDGMPMPISDLHYFVAHKKSGTPSSAEPLIASYNYPRQYYRPLFDDTQ